MFEPSIEKTIISTAIVLWFAMGWYMNERLKLVHEKLDKVLEQFNGLREYLYEIDPQFNEERRLREEFEESFSSGEAGLSGYRDMEYQQKLKAEGKRTLNTRFNENEA